jgi:hypothetical protein
MESDDSVTCGGFIQEKQARILHQLDTNLHRNTHTHTHTHTHM